MIIFINQLRERGEKLEEAIIHGSITRLRPVLMTALVAIARLRADGDRDRDRRGGPAAACDRGHRRPHLERRC
jgi:hypothetical protein